MCMMCAALVLRLFIYAHQKKPFGSELLSDESENYFSRLPGGIIINICRLNSILVSSKYNEDDHFLHNLISEQHLKIQTIPNQPST